MQEEHFDAIVIGSGQGGNPLATAMARHGWKIAVVERRYVGGTCVNDGCTPSKTVEASARVAFLSRHGAQWGVEGSAGVHMNMHRVWERKQQIVLASRASNTDGIEKIGTLVFGEASFAEQPAAPGMHAITVRMNDGSAERRLVAPRIFLNTGERPVVPQIPGLADVPFLDSTSILDLQEVPTHLVVLGAGYIALEFAQSFLRFGARVTVLERGERIAAHEDEDVAECLRSILIEDGIEILTCASVDHVSGGAGDLTVQVTTDDGPQTLKGSHLLIAVGRTPNVEPLHLARVGVEQTSRGHVKVNDRLETGVTGIWAIGDVKGGPAFTHISYDDYRILRTNLLEGGSASIAGRLTNYVMFTDPELGRIGLSESEARQQGIAVRVARMPLSYMARAKEMGEPRGMMKVLVDPATKKILGFTIVGVDGGEVAAQVQLAMMGGLPYTALRDAVFAHPTKAEALNTIFGKFVDGKE